MIPCLPCPIQRAGCPGHYWFMSPHFGGSLVELNGMACWTLGSESDHPTGPDVSSTFHSSTQHAVQSCDCVYCLPSARSQANCVNLWDSLIHKTWTMTAASPGWQVNLCEKRHNPLHKLSTHWVGSEGFKSLYIHELHKNNKCPMTKLVEK